MTFTKKHLAFDFQLAEGSFDTGGNNTSIQGLRASVAIAQHGSPSMGQCAAAIYGLPLSTMNKLTTLGTEIAAVGKNFITVYAYEDGQQKAVAYKGTIMQGYADLRAQPQACFRVEALVGLYEAVAPVDPTSVRGSADVVDVMKQIGKKCGLTLENNGVNCKITDPYLWSSGREQIKALAKAAGIEWLIEKDKIVIWNKDKPRDGAAVLISSATGMRGYPTFTSAGVEVVTLFNANLKYGGQIEVKSDITPACGKWYINDLNHDLDSEMPNGAWFTTISASRTKT